MIQDSVSRRKFLKVAGAGVASTALSSRAVSYAHILGADDRVRVGIVGFSDRSRSTLIPAFHSHSKELNFEFVALSDIWKKRRDEGVAFVQKLTGTNLVPTRNNEELYRDNYFSCCRRRDY